jgi:glycosyltransferase involved in cell wall biosynthesis
MQATVLIPTHNHGPTLARAIQSVLAQTVEDIEVFVIGDGAPDFTRELMADIQRRDSRVRYFDHPKGPRHGEVYRHAALAEARGEIICYLSDDDLYLPNHVENMRQLLRDADFAHSLPVLVIPGGTIEVLTVDLSLPADRELILFGSNRIPLPCGAHTLKLYRKLPHGWRTTPRGIYTDLYMWQQILGYPGCRAVSGTRPTIISFPSPLRQNWATDERCAELDRWSKRLADEAGRENFIFEVLDATVRDRASKVATYRTSNTVRLRDSLLNLPLVGPALISLSRAVTGRPARDSV